jgi:DNA processing protein
MYERVEEDVIVVDSFDKLTYRQKKLFLCSLNNNLPDKEKFKQILIKAVGESLYNKIRGDFFDEGYRTKVVDALNKSNVKCITVKSDSYPQDLLSTSVPPLVLYCRGNLDLLKDRLFAVVGSRKTLPQVVEACRQISAELTEHFTIVSGTTDGAETAAVNGAIESGKVICVIPNGFNHIYPASAVDLFHEVEKKGLLVSEFPPDTPTQKYMFSLRNRIVAGLACGTLIVSAAQKSGSLITAEYAMNYGREVFAFPYSLGLTSGEGCNALIKKGANLVDNVLDIFNVFGLECKQEDVVELTEEESKLITILKDNGETHVEIIARQMERKSYELAPMLSALEIKGLISRCGGNKYCAVK